MTFGANGTSPDTRDDRWSQIRAIGRKVVQSYFQGLGVVVGTSLVLTGLSRRSLGGVVLAAGGAALIARSITGRWLPSRQSTGAADSGTAADFVVVESVSANGRDVVDEAGFDSFPASDPPAYSPR